jgi:uncharacterized protein
MGFVLLLFRRKSDESLLKWAFALMAVPIVTYIVIYALFAAFVSPEAIAGFEASQVERWNESVRIVSQGSYLQIVSSYNLEYFVGRWAGLILQMRLPKILAMFLLGLYTYRRGYFQDLEANRLFIRKVLVYGFVLGLAGNMIFAAFASNEAPFPPSAAGLIGVIAYSFGVPAMALFIAAVIAELWLREAWRPVLSRLAPVGRMALTNYLLQTVICVVIFYGFGFGLFGRFGAAASTAIAVVIFAAQIVLSSVWLKNFAYGPMEWIWRQLTYRRRLDLRIHTGQPTAG